MVFIGDFLKFGKIKFYAQVKNSLKFVGKFVNFTGVAIALFSPSERRSMDNATRHNYVLNITFLWVMTLFIVISNFPYTL